MGAITQGLMAGLAIRQRREEAATLRQIQERQMQLGFLTTAMKVMDLPPNMRGPFVDWMAQDYQRMTGQALPDPILGALKKANDEEQVAAVKATLSQFGVDFDPTELAKVVRDPKVWLDVGLKAAGAKQARDRAQTFAGYTGGAPTGAPGAELPPGLTEPQPYTLRTAPTTTPEGPPTLPAPQNAQDAIQNLETAADAISRRLEQVSSLGALSEEEKRSVDLLTNRRDSLLSRAKDLRAQVAKAEEQRAKEREPLTDIGKLYTERDRAQAAGNTELVQGINAEIARHRGGSASEIGKKWDDYNAALAAGDAAKAAGILAVIKKEAREGGANGLTPEQIFQHEKSLRTEFTTQSKNFETTKDAYTQVQSGFNSPLGSGPGDEQMVYGFARMIDPQATRTVEGRSLRLRESGPLADWVQKTYQRITSGGQLTSDDRARIMARANDTMKVAFKEQRTVEAKHRKLALGIPGVRPEAVVEPVPELELQKVTEPTGSTVGEVVGGQWKPSAFPTPGAKGTAPATEVPSAIYNRLRGLLKK